MDTQSQRYLKLYEGERERIKMSRKRGGRNKKRGCGVWSWWLCYKEHWLPKPAPRVLTRVKLCIVLEGWPHGKQIKKTRVFDFRSWGRKRTVASTDRSWNSLFGKELKPLLKTERTSVNRQVSTAVSLRSEIRFPKCRLQEGDEVHNSHHLDKNR